MALHDFSRHATDILIAQMNADPGIPTSNPSVSGWQVPPHPLSEARSANLPPVTEFAIIGSGASGCSVASNLLQNELSGDQRVTVFEARTLTSGATGRNGGQLLTHIPKFYKTYAEAHGKEAAGRIARYALRTVDKMVDIAYSEDLGACEVRKVRDVMAFEDEEGFNAAVSSVRLYEEALSEENDKYSIIDKDSAKKVSMARKQYLESFHAFMRESSADDEAVCVASPTQECGWGFDCHSLGILAIPSIHWDLPAAS